MKYCTEFAFANRKLMMERIQQVVSATINNAVYEPIINIAHNYAAWETHFDTKVIVHARAQHRRRMAKRVLSPARRGQNRILLKDLAIPKVL